MLQLFISINSMILMAQKYAFLPALYPSDITLNIKCVGSVTASEILFPITSSERHAARRRLFKGTLLVGRQTVNIALLVASAFLPPQTLGTRRCPSAPAPGGGRHTAGRSRPSPTLKLEGFNLKSRPIRSLALCYPRFWKRSRWRAGSPPAPRIRFASLCCRDPGSALKIRRESYK